MKLIIPGTPVAQKRARAYRRGSGVRFYDSQGKEREAVVAAVKKQVSCDGPLFKEGEVLCLSFSFLMPVPSSYSNKKKFDLYGTRHVKKPDLSNLIKFYEDALNGIIWHDDNQISAIKAMKYYSPTPQTIMEIYDHEHICSSFHSPSRPEASGCDYS